LSIFLIILGYIPINKRLPGMLWIAFYLHNISAMILSLVKKKGEFSYE